MLTALDAPTFRRAAAAKAEGLTCAVALPVFVAERLTAVVVLFCGGDQDHAGAIELWHNAPADSVDMNLQEGFYGSTGDTFEFLSRCTSFRVGTGLPGRTWQRQGPVYMPDLGRGSGFLRADSAVKVGINRGFAIPCSCADGDNYVLAMLSALATPIAQRVDVWEPDVLQSSLAYSFGFSEGGLSQAASPNDKQPVTSVPIGQVYCSGVPVLQGQTVLIPIGMQGRMTAVVGLTL
jgi:hypothetical protein